MVVQFYLSAPEYNRDIMAEFYKSRRDRKSNEDVTKKTVFLGLVTDCLLAKRPTNLSPVFEIATIEGNVLDPSAFSIIFG